MTNIRFGIRSFIASVLCLFGVASIAVAQVVDEPIIQTQDITTPNPEGGDYEDFGYAVSLDIQSEPEISQMLVGVPIWGNAVPIGFVRLFDFDATNNTWIVSGNQLPDQSSNGIDFGWYGMALSILGDSAVVGVPMRDPIPPHDGIFRDGAAFIYRWTGSEWITTEMPGTTAANLGTSVSQIENFIAIGAPFRNLFQGGDYGGVHIYERAAAGDAWASESILEAPLDSEEFGDSVALFTDQANDDWLVVGAPAPDVETVYVYKRGPIGWGTPSMLVPHSGTSPSRFGDSVTITETANDLWIFVAAPHDFQGEQARDYGRVEIFRLNGSTWDYVDFVEAPVKRSGGTFGTSLDASGNQVVIGSYGAYSCDPNGKLPPTNGAGYVLTYDGNTWSVVTTINKLITREGFGALGTSVAIDGGMVAVGAPSAADGGKVLTYTTLLSASIDCDGNGADALEWCSGIALDCNGNDKSDACEILEGTSQDCDHNGILDECELTTGVALDCDGNGVPDQCDLFYGTGVDCDGNGVLDACELTNGLHLIFMTDGSGMSQVDYDVQLTAITQELCNDTTYSQIDPLIVSVIHITDNPQADVGPVWFQPGAIGDAICDDITALSQFGSSSNLLGALVKAKELFNAEGSSFAREIILISQGTVLDWSACQAEGNLLRSMTPPVRIGCALIPYIGPCVHSEMSMLANTLDPVHHNPNQPRGPLFCMANNYSMFHFLCQTSLSDQWGWGKDCNVNGLLDYEDPQVDCDPCLGNITGDMSIEFGAVDVSDMLLVVSEWGPCPDPYPCYGDINCDGSVDVTDLLIIMGNWGPCGGTVMGLPQTVQDCLNRYPLGSLQLEKCLEIVEYLQNQGN